MTGVGRLAEYEARLAEYEARLAATAGRLAGEERAELLSRLEVELGVFLAGRHPRWDYDMVRRRAARVAQAGLAAGEPVAHVARRLGVSRPTVYDDLREFRAWVARGGFHSERAALDAALPNGRDRRERIERLLEESARVRFQQATQAPPTPGFTHQIVARDG